MSRHAHMILLIGLASQASASFTFYESGSQAASDQLKAGPCRQHITMALVELASKHVDFRALLAEQGGGALQDQLGSYMVNTFLIAHKACPKVCRQPCRLHQVSVVGCSPGSPG